MFSSSIFWDKLKKNVHAMGCPLLCHSLVLYYAMIDPTTPKWAKATIAGALVYLVNPLDAVPDFFPLAGYGDDLASLVTALKVLSEFVDAKHWDLAGSKAREFLPNCDCGADHKK